MRRLARPHVLLAALLVYLLVGGWVAGSWFLYFFGGLATLVWAAVVWIGRGKRRQRRGAALGLVGLGLCSAGYLAGVHPGMMSSWVNPPVQAEPAPEISPSSSHSVTPSATPTASPSPTPSRSRISMPVPAPATATWVPPVVSASTQPAWTPEPEAVPEPVRTTRAPEAPVNQGPVVRVPTQPRPSVVEFGNGTNSNGSGGTTSAPATAPTATSPTTTSPTTRAQDPAPTVPSDTQPGTAPAPDRVTTRPSGGASRRIASPAADGQIAGQAAASPTSGPIG
ncbi:hypothetical protein ACTQ49_03525 [Luteococcus sp. Sow4_B9]|uniref:hypothetical protein n=1 Tax=Luteococcus sp. Sow4_B9 TaxID=3438792 RepID=UPI003F995629